VGGVDPIHAPGGLVDAGWARCRFIADPRRKEPGAYRPALKRLLRDLKVETAGPSSAA
jgi:hypothetical protein